MRTYFAFVTTICLLFAHTASAQLFTSDLDDATGWGVVADDDTNYMFGFDYSPFGIPAAPSGTGTTGVAMMANITDAPAGGGATVALYPEGLSLSGQYRVEVDMWLNFNTSGGTTEAGGLSVGFTPDSTINGATFVGNSDGDSSRDFQLFKDGTEILYDPAVYAISSQNNNAADLVAAFPGQPTPDAQGAAPFDPTNTIVTAADGSLGFAWHTLAADVDTNAGTATFYVGDVEIGTVTGADLTGGFALTYLDPFGSVASKPEFAFGVFDNVSVTQVPEPSSIALLCAGILGLGATRRRR